MRDPQTGATWGYVVVDHTGRGPGLGGTRMAADVSLEEVARLARTMTLKNSAACLPFGGGKSGIVTDPIQWARQPDLRSELITRFAEALFALDRYIPAPDMGTQEKDIQRIFEVFSEKLGRTDHMRGGAGRPPEQGGIPIDDWGLTAHGLVAAARTLEELEPGFRIRGARGVIQGYGNVGAWTASKLHAAGAVIVGASDIHAALWHPKGLNVDTLNRVRRQPGGLRGYEGPVEKRFGPEKLDWLLEAPCDLLVPAARPDAITARNADRIDCRIILQGANTPSNKMTEYYLEHRRKILSLSDFIVNVGGVVGCAVELKMNADPDYKKKVLAPGLRSYLETLIEHTVSRNVREIFRLRTLPANEQRIFREVALDLAQERLHSRMGEVWL